MENQKKSNLDVDPDCKTYAARQTPSHRSHLHTWPSGGCAFTSFGRIIQRIHEFLRCIAAHVAAEARPVPQGTRSKAARQAYL